MTKKMSHNLIKVLKTCQWGNVGLSGAGDSQGKLQWSLLSTAR